MNEEKSYIEKTLDDHEVRLRKLEESDIRQQIQLTEIQKSQSDIKLMLNENQNKLLDTITGLINNTVSTKNKIKLMDRKEMWGTIALIVGALCTYFGLK